MRSHPSRDDLAGIPDPFEGAAAPWPQRSPPVIGAAANLAGSTRSTRHQVRYAAAGAALFYEIAWVIFVERRADLAALPASRIALGLMIPWAALAVALVAAVQRGRIGLGASTTYLKACVLLSVCFFAIATWLVAPHAPAGSAAPFWHRTAVCASVTAILTAVPLGLGVLAFRRAFVAAATWRTALLGVACGALAASTMSIVCQDAAPLHVLLGHGTMMVVGGVLGAFFGRHVARA
jgi:hypothetical protein